MLTVAPDGIDTVEVLLPERPFTLQVIAVLVTSVTGLLFGGMRMAVFIP